MTSLDYRLLGRSGMRVCELALGTMTFGADSGWGADDAAVRNIYEAYRAAGGNYLDTANQYAGGRSEELVGELVGPHRDEVVIATKYTNSGPGAGANASGNQRKNMVQSLEQSLRRLNTDYVDLYVMHAWDQMTPIEEVMRAFDDLVRSGKVLHIGISNTPAWVVAKANTLAELRGWSQFVGMQVEYSLLARTVERDVMPMSADQHMTLLAWSPLKNGLLTGKYESGGATGSRLDTEFFRSDLIKDVVNTDDAGRAVIREVMSIAAECGVSSAQVALAWLMSRPVPVIPIIGASKVTQVEDNLRAADLALDVEQLARLDNASAVAPGYPHDYLASDMARTFSTGGLYERIKR